MAFTLQHMIQVLQSLLIYHDKKCKSKQFQLHNVKQMKIVGQINVAVAKFHVEK